MFLWCFVGALIALVYYFLFVWKINYVRKLKTDYKSPIGKWVRKVGDLPPVYPNGWFGLMESNDLKKGQVKHVSALGENFAVFRTESGTVSIIDAYCPHLGANLAEGGRVKGDCLQCPFHDWTFSGDGKCQRIPYAKTVPSGVKTKAWKCCEVNQTIFVWYHAESEEPNWQLEAIPEISNGNWQYQGRNEFYVKCHIQEIPENGADWAHLSAVHGPALLPISISTRVAHHSWTDVIWSAEALTESSEINAESLCQKNLSDEASNTRHKAMLRLNHSFVVLEKYSIMQLKVKAQQIGPAYVELFLASELGPMCMLQCVTPIEPLLQRVTHIIFSPALLGPFAKLTFFCESLMFERDIAVWNHKKYQKNPVLVREDRTLSAFRRWYSQFYSTSSPTYQSTALLNW